MPNKELGIADPVYDALRIRSGQSIAPDLGGGSFGAGGLENKIQVWHADGSAIDLFDATETGLNSALSAASTGDTVWLPSISITLTAAITIPADIVVTAISGQAKLLFGTLASAAITLSASSGLERLYIQQTANDANNLVTIVGPGSGVARIGDCVVICTQAGAGTATAIDAGAGTIYIQDSTLTGAVENNGTLNNVEITGNLTNLAGGLCKYVFVTAATGTGITQSANASLEHCRITMGAGTTYGIDVSNGYVLYCVVGTTGGTTNTGIYAHGANVEINGSRFAGYTGGKIEQAYTVANCEFYSSGSAPATDSHGLVHATTGTAPISNSTFITGSANSFGASISATGLTLTDCYWNSIDGIANIAYGTGDRGAYSVENYHATDIEAAVLTRHLPAPTGSAGDAGKYPKLNIAGTAYELSATAGSGVIPPGTAINAYGDSIAAGHNASDAAHRWPNIVAAARGWTLNNQAVDGSRMIDVADQTYALTVAQDAQSMGLFGYNDMRDGGTGDAGQKTTFQDALYAQAAWLAIPETKKIRAQDSGAVSETGTWADSVTAYGVGLSRLSTVVNSTATFVVYGRTIYIGATRRVGATGDTIGVSVDTVSQGTWSCLGLTGDAYTGRNFGPFLIRLTGFIDGPHTVVITYTAGSDYISWDWAAGADGAAEEDGPNVYLGNTLRMTPTGYVLVGQPDNGSDLAASQYNDLVSAVARDLSLDGLQVAAVDAEAYYNPNAGDVDVDDIHPNDTGHAHIAEAFLHTMDLRVHPGAGGIGTVTSIAAGTGITATPDPITSTGTIALNAALNDLNDVDTTGTGTGDIIYNNAGTWQDYPLGIGSRVTASGTKIRFGNIGSGNYLEIDSVTGTLRLVGDATTWDDFRVEASVVKPGATAPNWKAFGPSGNLQALMFEASHHDEAYFEMQMPHNWLIGSNIYPHVHWTPVNTTAGNVVWELEYAWSNVGDAFSAPGNMATDATAAGGVAWVHKLTDFKESSNNYISGTGKTLSSMLVCRLHRNSNSGSDTLNQDVALLEVDFHYQIDSLGSDERLVKDASASLLLETGDILLLETGDRLLTE